MLRDVKLFRYDLFALWTMRDALEHPLSDSGPAQKNVKSQRELSLCSIPAAVRLVEIIGKLMYSWDHEFEHSPLEAPGGGDLCGMASMDFVENDGIFGTKDLLS